MGNVFCVLPFISMQLKQDGNAYPCCRMSSPHPYGSLKTESLADIWRGEELAATRKNMLENKPVSFCSDCYKVEAAGGASLRQKSNIEFADKANDILKNPQSLTISYLDIRFSNTCNLKCRSCDATSSSSWYEDASEVFPPSSAEKHLLLSQKAPGFWEQLEEQMDSLEKVYFAGGEPLIDRDHYRFLELLIKKKRTDIILSYNTNLTFLKFANWDVRKLWPQFRQVQVGASIDGTGKMAEYLRTGSSWPVVRNNLLQLKELPNVTCTIFPTVGILNCFHLPVLIREMLDLKMIEIPENFEINVLHKPDNLSAFVLPAKEKAQLRLLYVEFLAQIKTSLPAATHGHIENELLGFLNLVDSIDGNNFKNDFRKFVFKIDQLRGERAVLHAPELFSVLYE